MAEAYSDWGWYNGQGMRAHVVAWCEYTDDDHFKIIVTGNTQCSCGTGWGMQSQVGYDARYSGISGTYSGAGAGSLSWNWCREYHTFESQESGWADYHREEFGPFPCDGGEHWVTVWYKCWATGSWGGGQRDAFASLQVPRNRQHTPHRPKNFTVARSSDTVQRLAWTGDYTGYEGHYTWAYVHVERRDGDGSWHEVTRLGWGATNWSDTSTISGWKYGYRLRASNWDGAFSAYTNEISVYTTPNGIGGLSIEKTADHTVVLTGTNLWGWRTGVNAQIRVNGADWADKELEQLAPGSWRDGSAPAGTVEYRIRAYVAQGGSSNPARLLYGPWTASDSVTTVCPPNAPAVTVDTPVIYPSKSSVAWVPNHPDGSSQADAQVEVTDGNGKVTVYDAGTATALQLTMPYGESKVRVRTKGLDDDWGAWSASSKVVAAMPPAIGITKPERPYDGSNPQKRVPIAFEWYVLDSTGITSQVFAILKEDGSELYRASLGGSANSLSLTADLGFENKSRYTLRLEVTGGSGLNSSAERSIYTDWAQPVPPDPTVSFTEDLAATVTVEAGIDDSQYCFEDTSLVGPMTEADGVVTMLGDVTVEDTALVLEGVLNIESFDIARVDPDGARTSLGTDLPLGYRVVDQLPPLNVDYDYEVTAKTSLGTVCKVVKTVLCDSKGMEAFNFGAAANEVVLLGLDADASESIELTGQSFNFALGADTELMPTFYPDGELDSLRSLSYKVHTRQEYESLRRLVRSRNFSHFWYRDYWGHRMYAHGKWGLSYSAKSYGLWEVSVSPEEVCWREPIHG